MLSSSDEEFNFTSESVKQKARGLLEDLPLISKERYLKTYDEFNRWRKEKNEKSMSERVLIKYFYELSEKLKPPTMWCIYSMLKSTIYTKHDIDLKYYYRVTTFLKKQSTGYKCKKTKVFTAEQVETFLNEAPDEMYLAAKVCLIFGITGACRTIELASMTLQDVEYHGDLLLIKFPNTRTKIDRNFVVKKEFVKFIKKYQDLRPDKVHTNRFFLKYYKGRCIQQVIGKNKLATMPKLIAKYLNLPNADTLYTGRTFLKTSAVLANSRINVPRNHDGRKSSTVAGEHKEYSVENDIIVNSRITENEPHTCSSMDYHDDISQIMEPKLRPVTEEIAQSLQDSNVSNELLPLSFIDCSSDNFNQIKQLKIEPGTGKSMQDNSSSEPFLSSFMEFQGDNLSPIQEPKLEPVTEETGQAMQDSPAAVSPNVQIPVKPDARDALIMSLKREVEALQAKNKHLKTTMHVQDNNLDTSSKSLDHTKQSQKELNELLALTPAKLVALVQLHKKENNALRTEITELLGVRNQLLQDQELLSRENEQLLKKLEDINSVLREITSST